LALDPEQKLAPNWKRYLLPLNDRDLRAPIRDEDQPSEGRTQYSWIWISSHPPPLSPASNGDLQHTTPAPTSSLPTWAGSTGGRAAGDEDSQDFDRVQWAKCQARAKRYEEEVQLTIEEMGRTLRYFEWKQDWWCSLKPEHTGRECTPDIRDGLHAYACRQSNLYDQLVTSFVTHWRPYLLARSLGSSWLNKYTSHVAPVPTHNGRQKTDTGSTPVITNTNIPASSELPGNPKPSTDAPLDSGSDDDSEGNRDHVGADEDAGDSVDAEDMFADDW